MQDCHWCVVLLCHLVVHFGVAHIHGFLCRLSPRVCVCVCVSLKKTIYSAISRLESDVRLAYRRVGASFHSWSDRLIEIWEPHAHSAEKTQKNTSEISQTVSHSGLIQSAELSVPDYRLSACSSWVRQHFNARFAACVGGARRPSLNNDLHRRLLTGKCLLYFSQTFFFTFFFIWLYLAKLHPPREPKEDKTNTLELTNKASSALEHETFMNLAWKSDFHVIRSKGDFRPIARRGFLLDRNQHFYFKKKIPFYADLS